VTYTEDERAVVLLFRPLCCCASARPEYEVSRNRGIVRWRIESGLLVHHRAGARRPGYLEIDVRLVPQAEEGVSTRARRGRGGELLPRDRDLAHRLRLLAHAVEDPT
jgi:hypothetical protein